MGVNLKTIPLFLYIIFDVFLWQYNLIIQEDKILNNI